MKRHLIDDYQRGVAPPRKRLSRVDGSDRVGALSGVLLTTLLLLVCVEAGNAQGPFPGIGDLIFSLMPPVDGAAFATSMGECSEEFVHSESLSGPKVELEKPERPLFFSTHCLFCNEERRRFAAFLDRIDGLYEEVSAAQNMALIGEIKAEIETMDAIPRARLRNYLDRVARFVVAQRGVALEYLLSGSLPAQKTAIAVLRALSADPHPWPAEITESLLGVARDVDADPDLRCQILLYLSADFPLEDLESLATEEPDPQTATCAARQFVGRVIQLAESDVVDTIRTLWSSASGPLQQHAAFQLAHREVAEELVPDLCAVMLDGEAHPMSRFEAIRASRGYIDDRGIVSCLHSMLAPEMWFRGRTGHRCSTSRHGLVDVVDVLGNVGNLSLVPFLDELRGDIARIPSRVDQNEIRRSIDTAIRRIYQKPCPDGGRAVGIPGALQPVREHLAVVPEGSGSSGRRLSTSHPMSCPQIARGDLGMISDLRLLHVDDWENVKRESGGRLLLVNGTARRADFIADNGVLKLVLEAQDPSGAWKQIEPATSRWRGNSRQQVFLYPGEYWSFTLSARKGDLTTQLRYRVSLRDGTAVYSGPISGKIDEELLSRS